MTLIALPFEINVLAIGERRIALLDDIDVTRTCIARLDVDLCEQVE